MSSSPETVHAVVLNVEDAPVDPDAEEQLDRGQGRVAGLVGLARFAWRITAFARRPFAAPFALANPIVRGVAGTESGPAVAVRHDGRAISVREWAAAHRLAGASPRVLVLVPPPGKSETVWDEGSQMTGATYAGRLAELLGWLPLHLHVAAGTKSVPAAVALSSRIQECVDALAAESDGDAAGSPRIVLVGYAGGGLIARNALGVATSGDRPWTTYVSELIALGTTPYAVTSAPISRGVGKQIDEHLAGIAVVGPDEAMLPPRPDVDYLLVTDKATSRPNRVGRLFGEMLWWRHKTPLGSRRVRDLFPTAERFTLSTAETPLSNHPAVHDALLRWLA
ncbi:hypothetical protein [Nocardioides panzhihuensis]|uniref:Alpha/beta hydrolase n=1 Tax=Nocardioides panzhihuensis TaxID=860243 RepID=A0A7Z0IQU5_9ACTN|nr:hypothetical protein [Nocardioides panzhihuensis]NYI76143.1 hypothetical protein [Nocardioides panzhihuensis]